MFIHSLLTYLLAHLFSHSSVYPFIHPFFVYTKYKAKHKHTGLLQICGGSQIRSSAYRRISRMRPLEMDKETRVGAHQCLLKPLCTLTTCFLAESISRRPDLRPTWTTLTDLRTPDNGDNQQQKKQPSSRRLCRRIVCTHACRTPAENCLWASCAQISALYYEAERNQNQQVSK